MLIMQNDGNLVEYDRQSYKAIWWSGTRRDVAEENVEVKKAALQCFTRAPTAAPIANPTASPSFSPSAAPTPLPTVSPSRWTEVFSDSNAYSQNADHYKTSGNDLVVLADSPGPACTQVISLFVFRFHFHAKSRTFFPFIAVAENSLLIIIYSFSNNRPKPLSTLSTLINARAMVTSAIRAQTLQMSLLRSIISLVCATRSPAKRVEV